MMAVSETIDLLPSRPRMMDRGVFRPAPFRGVDRSLAGPRSARTARPAPVASLEPQAIGGVFVMTRSYRWPLVAACLVGGLAVGRYVGQPQAQGQLPPAGKAIPQELT